MIGGFGSAVAEALTEAEVMAKLKRFGVPDILVDHAKPDQSFADLGLTAPQISEQILSSWFAEKPAVVAS